VGRNVSGWGHGLINVNPGILVCVLWRGMCQNGGNGLISVNPGILICALWRGMCQDGVMV